MKFKSLEFVTLSRNKKKDEIRYFEKSELKSAISFIPANLLTKIEPTPIIS